MVGILILSKHFTPLLNSKTFSTTNISLESLLSYLDELTSIQWMEYSLLKFVNEGSHLIL